MSKCVEKISLHIDYKTMAVTVLPALVVQPKATLVFNVTTPNGEVFREVKSMKLKVGKVYTVSVEGRDVAGNVAPIDGLRELTVTDPSAFKVSIDANGVATVEPLGPIVDETVVLQAVVDGVVGEGENLIMGELTLGSIPGDAVTVALALTEQ